MVDLEFEGTLESLHMAENTGWGASGGAWSAVTEICHLPVCPRPWGTSPGIPWLLLGPPVQERCWEKIKDPDKSTYAAEGSKASGLDPSGLGKAEGESEAAAATWRGATKVMEPNPSQQGAAATRAVAWEGHTGHEEKIFQQEGRAAAGQLTQGGFGCSVLRNLQELAEQNWPDTALAAAQPSCCEQRAPVLPSWEYQVFLSHLAPPSFSWV